MLASPSVYVPFLSHSNFSSYLKTEFMETRWRSSELGVCFKHVKYFSAPLYLRTLWCYTNAVIIIIIIIPPFLCYHALPYIRHTLIYTVVNVVGHVTQVMPYLTQFRFLWWHFLWSIFLPHLKFVPSAVPDILKRSQNYKSRSPNPGHVPLIQFCIFCIVLTESKRHNKFEVCSFSRSRDIEGKIAAYLTTSCAYTLMYAVYVMLPLIWPNKSIDAPSLYLINPAWQWHTGYIGYDIHTSCHARQHNKYWHAGQVTTGFSTCKKLPHNGAKRLETTVPRL